MNKRTKSLKNVLLLTFLNFLFFILITCNPVIGGDGDSGDSGGGDTGNSNVTAAPSFSLAEGYHTEDKILELDCATPGSTVYFIRDPESATAVPEEYLGSISLTGPGVDYTIEAYAVCPGKENSPRIRKTFKITGKLFITPDIINRDKVVNDGEYPKISIEVRDRNTNPVADAKILYTVVTDKDFGDTTPDPVTNEGIPFYYDSTDDAILLTDGISIKAIAYKEGWLNSDYENYAIPLNSPPPIFDPVDGSIVTSTTSISIFCKLRNPSITYKTIGYTENDSSFATATEYPYRDIPFTIGSPSKIRAVAEGPGWDPSDPVIVTYKMQLPPPTYNPAPSTTTPYSTTQRVTLNSSASIPNLKIKYKINNEPTADVDPGFQLNISDTSTITAWTFIAGDESGDAKGWVMSEPNEKTYFFLIDKPRVDPPGDITYYSVLDGMNSIKVFYNNPANVDIYFLLTHDNSNDVTPVNGTLYTISPTSSIPLDPSLVNAGNHDGTVYLKVKAFRKDNPDLSSDMITEKYTFKLENPYIPSGIPSNDPFNVVPTHPMQAEGVRIKYTTDPTAGSIPTTELPYDATADKMDPIQIDKTTKLKVVATKKGWKDSDIVEKTYSLAPYPPIFYVKGTTHSTGGSYNENITLMAYDKNVAYGSTIFYTDNSTDPTDPSNLSRKTCMDRDEIQITQSTKIIAVSYIENWGYSSPITNDYELIVKKPVISLSGSGLKYKATFTCDTPGAMIYYTFDGSDPLTSTDKGPSGSIIDLPGSSVIRAIAVKSNWTNSEEATDEQIIKLPYPELVIEPTTDSVEYLKERVEDAVTGNVTYTYTYLMNDAPLGNIYIKCTDDADAAIPSVDVRYTTDVSDPSGDVGNYYPLIWESRIAITDPNTVIKSIAYDTNAIKRYHNSPINTSIFRFKVRQPNFAAPYHIPNNAGAGVHESGINDNTGRILPLSTSSLSINCATKDATVDYTITAADGAPLGSGTLSIVGGSATITGLPERSGFTITLKAGRDGWVDSATTTATFYRRLNKPSITCTDLEDLATAGMSTLTNANVNIGHSNTYSNLRIRYKINSTTGSSTSNPYTFNITGTTQVEAWVSDDSNQWLDSTHSTKTYYKCTAPSFNQIDGYTANGIWNTTFSKSAGTTIYYSTDGTGYSLAASDRAPVNGKTEMYIRAQRAGYLMSDPVGSRTYHSKISPLTITPTTGSTLNEGSNVTVKITSPDGGSITYLIEDNAGNTIAGGTTTNSTYTVIFAPDRDFTVKATAGKDKWVTSDEANASYRVKCAIPSGLITNSGSQLLINASTLKAGSVIEYKIIYRLSPTDPWLYYYGGIATYATRPESSGNLNIHIGTGVNNANNIYVSNASTAAAASTTLQAQIVVKISHPNNYYDSNLVSPTPTISK